MYVVVANSGASALYNIPFTDIGTGPYNVSLPITSHSFPHPDSFTHVFISEKAFTSGKSGYCLSFGMTVAPAATDFYRVECHGSAYTATVKKVIVSSNESNGYVVRETVRFGGSGHLCIGVSFYDETNAFYSFSKCASTLASCTPLPPPPLPSPPLLLLLLLLHFLSWSSFSTLRLFCPLSFLTSLCPLLLTS